MKLHHHAAISTTISLLLFMIFKSWYLSIACFISGVFIDLDHFVDYFREQGINLDIKNFFKTCEKAQFEKIVLFFHGWEWLLLLSLSAWFWGWNLIVVGITIGVGHHLILDAYYNRADIKTYSLIWRWSKGFDFDTTFPSVLPIKYKYKKNP